VLYHLLDNKRALKFFNKFLKNQNFLIFFTKFPTNPHKLYIVEKPFQSAIKSPKSPASNALSDLLFRKNTFCAPLSRFGRAIVWELLRIAQPSAIAHFVAKIYGYNNYGLEFFKKEQLFRDKRKKLQNFPIYKGIFTRQILQLLNRIVFGPFFSYINYI